MSESTRYLCLHCDLGFEVELDAEPRCPRCMRMGIPAPKVAAPEPRSKRWLTVGAFVAAAALGGGAYAAWASTRPARVTDEVPDRPLERAELEGHLVRLGLERHALAPTWRSSDDVEALFERELASGDDEAKVAAVGRALRSRFADSKLVPASARGFRTGPVRAPAVLATALRGREVRIEASSVEVALLACVALREAGVPARLAEVFAFEGEASPADPAGHAGYYVVALPDPRGNTYVDVASPRDRQPASDAVRVLDDLQAVGALELARAVVALGRDRDAGGAMTSVDRVLGLDPRSPSARGLRAIVLLAAGDVDAAVEEANAAVALRRDAPRLALLAGVELGRGEGERAERLATEAVGLSPDHGSSHAVLAMIALARRDVERARRELDVVQRVDPEYERLDAMSALLHGMAGELPQANARLDAMIARRPRDARNRLDAAMIAAQAGLDGRVLGELRAGLELTSGDEREAMRRRIGEVFGASALAALATVGVPGMDASVEAAPPAADVPAADVPAAEAPPAPAAPAELPAPGRLQLGGPSLGRTGPGQGRSLLRP